VRNALFAALILGGILPLALRFLPGEKFPTPNAQWHARHAELQCFAEGVLKHTEPRATIRYVMPADVSDSGLINQRLRYLVPGRYIEAGEALPRSPSSRYLAVWHQPLPAGQVIWSGCGGVLVRQ
jgi:hypothetical protein